MKNNCISKRKKLIRRVGLFYIFENLFKVWLKEASWILISASAVNLLRYHTPCSLQKTPPGVHERMRLKTANKILVLL